MLLKKDKNGGWSYRRGGEGVVYRRVGGAGRGQTVCTHYAFRVPDLICEIGPGLQVLGHTFGVPGPRLGNRSKVSDFEFHQNFQILGPIFWICPEGNG